MTTYTATYYSATHQKSYQKAAATVLACKAFISHNADHPDAESSDFATIKTANGRYYAIWGRAYGYKMQGLALLTASDLAKQLCMIGADVNTMQACGIPVEDAPQQLTIFQADLPATTEEPAPATAEADYIPTLAEEAADLATEEAEAEPAADLIPSDCAALISDAGHLVMAIHHEDISQPDAAQADEEAAPAEQPAAGRRRRLERLHGIRQEPAAKPAELHPDGKTFIGQTIQGKGYRIHFSAEEQRTLLTFDAMPTREAREIAKAADFYWAPSKKAWVKGLTWRAYRAAQDTAKQLDKLPAILTAPRHPARATA